MVIIYFLPKKLICIVTCASDFMPVRFVPCLIRFSSSVCVFFTSLFYPIRIIHHPQCANTCYFFSFLIEYINLLSFYRAWLHDNSKFSCLPFSICRYSIVHNQIKPQLRGLSLISFNHYSSKSNNRYNTC